MTQINNDADFKKNLLTLDPVQQRLLATRFVEHVLPLSSDERIAHVMKTAAEENVSGSELATALQTARTATMDSQTRCGAEGDWAEQAGYFVARAAMAALTPVAQSSSGSPAWQAAMSARMAVTSSIIDDDSDDVPTHNESAWQYQALTDYLNA